MIEKQYEFVCPIDDCGTVKTHRTGIGGALYVGLHFLWQHPDTPTPSVEEFQAAQERGTDD